MIKILVVSLLVLLSQSLKAANDCGEGASLRTVCGFAAPEDIELAGDGQSLLIGEMVAGGRLLSLKLDDLSAAPIELYPALSEAGPPDWGSSDCQDYPRQMVFHGIDLSLRADGSWQLLAVNHGVRESVEFFQVVTNEDASPQGLIWRGCALAPGSENLNDVAALPQGGFLSSTPFVGSELWSIAKALLGFNTGHVRRWDQAAGWRTIPNTEGRYPNGVITDPDGRRFHVNMYIDGLVKTFLLDGTEVGSAKVINGDNLSWGEDGKIRIASHRAGMLDMVRALETPPDTNLRVPFAIVEYEPITGMVTDSFVHDGSEFGAATVAQQVGDKVVMGSFKGTRIAIAEVL